MAQAPAPEHLIEGGIPTEALIAAVVIAKYADHLPLYRQAQIYSRQGVELDRSTLADWSGRAAFALRPVYERLFDVLKGSDKLVARRRPRQNRQPPAGERTLEKFRKGGFRPSKTSCSARSCALGFRDRAQGARARVRVQSNDLQMRPPSTQPAVTR